MEVTFTNILTALVTTSVVLVTSVVATVIGVSVVVARFRATFKTNS